jgi:hypothetical protein
MAVWLVSIPDFRERARIVRESIAWGKVAQILPPSRCSRLLGALVIGPLLYSADPKALWLEYILPGCLPERGRGQTDSRRTFTMRLAARRVRAFAHPKQMNEQVAELVTAALDEVISSDMVRDSMRRR